MKKLALLLLLPGLVAIKSVSAQTTEHIKLSSQYPAAGEKITFTYDPTGTPLADKADPEGVIYFLDNKDNPAIDINFKHDGKLLTGAFTVPANTKFFFFSLKKDTTFDGNNNLGYTYFVYKNQQPVEGAHAQKAYMLASGMGAFYSKIKTDVPLALSLYKEELETYPESKKDYQAAYASLLIRSKDRAIKASADAQITEMAQSGDQKRMSDAAAVLRMLKKTGQADSLTAVIKSKFPDEIAKTDKRMAFNKETDPEKKEELYNEYVKTYTESTADKTIAMQDNMKLQVARAYLVAKKFDGYERIAAEIKNKMNLVGALNNTAFNMAKADENLGEAAKLSKQSLDIVKANIKNPQPQAYQSPKSVVKNNESMLDSYGDTYAYILAKQGNFKEAYTYEAPIYKKSKGMEANMNETYSTILKGLGKNQEAMQVIEEAIQKGKSTGVMVGTLKDVYTKQKGSDKGFEAYYSPLREVYIQKLKGDLLKEMISKPAPAFALKDFDGKTVSLADLKGKVVIVDFWATWCGPCKASFPGMQMAVTKFKDNPNVKFLFIDTWESTENFQVEAKKFIADNKYTFNVLFDEKNSEGKHGKIVADYGVDGIPTKFILDGNGNIRFKKVGFDGSAEALVDEVATMIDMTAHAATAPGGQKVSMIAVPNN